MKKKGFTILEMILVLTVITIIVLISLPNISQKKDLINDVGCKALIEVVDSQILAYEIDGRRVSSIDDLIKAGLITEKQATCPNGTRIYIENGQAKHE